MSSRHSAQSTSTGQAISADDQILDHRSEFYRLGCILLRFIIAMTEHHATQAIGRRVALLANATIIPDSGYVNARGGAAAMDMTEGSFKNLAARKNIPTVKPGDELIYRLSDLFKGGAK